MTVKLKYMFSMSQSHCQALLNEKKKKKKKKKKHYSVEGFSKNWYPNHEIRISKVVSHRGHLNPNCFHEAVLACSLDRSSLRPKLSVANTEVEQNELEAGSSANDACALGVFGLPLQKIV